MPDVTFVPPNNVAAEEAVLGSLLIDGSAISEVAGPLKPVDFCCERSGMMFDAALALRSRREPVDYLTLISELEHRNQLQEVGGAAYLVSLINATPTAVHAVGYAREVKEATIHRQSVSLRSVYLALADAGAISANPAVNLAACTLRVTGLRRRVCTVELTAQTASVVRRWLNLYALVLELFFEKQLLGQVPTEPVQFPYYQNIERLGARQIANMVELWQLQYRAAGTLVVFVEFGHDLVAAFLSVRAAHVELAQQVASFLVAVIAANAGVQDGSLSIPSSPSPNTLLSTTGAPGVICHPDRVMVDYSRTYVLYANQGNARYCHAKSIRASDSALQAIARR